MKIDLGSGTISAWPKRIGSVTYFQHVGHHEDREMKRLRIERLEKRTLLASIPSVIADVPEYDGGDLPDYALRTALLGNDVLFYGFTLEDGSTIASKIDGEWASIFKSDGLTSDLLPHGDHLYWSLYDTGIYRTDGISVEHLMDWPDDSAGDWSLQRQVGGTLYVLNFQWPENNDPDDAIRDFYSFDPDVGLEFIGQDIGSAHEIEFKIVNRKLRGMEMRLWDSLNGAGYEPHLIDAQGNAIFLMDFTVDPWGITSFSIYGVFDGDLYFQTLEYGTADNYHLWKTDGTPEGTIELPNTIWDDFEIEADRTTFKTRDDRYMEILPNPMGDVNSDGLVDLLDFDVLKSHFGMANSLRRTGDITGDRNTDLLDFTMIKDHFGQRAAIHDLVFASMAFEEVLS